MARTERIHAKPELLDEANAKSSYVLNKIRQAASKITFARHLVAMVFAFRDPDVPSGKKAIIAGAVLYFISPIDLIPDFIAGIGYADDAAVVMAAFKTVQDIITPDHYERADAFLQEMSRD